MATRQMLTVLLLLTFWLFTTREAIAGNLGSGGSELTAQALHYEHGEGVPINLGRAHALYCKAAALGDPLAAFNLAWMYLNGRGVSRDDAIAVHWLHKASDRGVVQASNLLGLFPRTLPSDSNGCPSEGAEARFSQAPKEIRDIVLEIAAQCGISSRLLLAVIFAESAFNPRAVSGKNAKGLMQLMPNIISRFGVKNPFDARENIRAGASYLKWLLQRFHGDLTLALAAYNAGEGSVDAYGGMPPYSETITYVDRIKQIYAHNTLTP